MKGSSAKYGWFKVLCLVPPPPAGLSSVQTDAVMARCAGIFTKADYLVPPLGLAYIAGNLWRMGFSVGILDCSAEGLEHKGAQRRLQELSPDVVITAVGTSTLANDRAFLARAKEESGGGLITVACGTHATVLPQELLGDGGVDYVVRGEPEVTCGELCKAMAEGRDVDGIEGLSFLRMGKVISAAERQLVEDIDELPPPVRDLLRSGAYSPPFAGGGRFATLLTTRGCPYPCIYCSTAAYFGRTLRRHSVGRVMEEIGQIERDYDAYGFWDDTFTLSKPYVIAICRGIMERGYSLPWICMSRVDTVDGEMLSAMKSAGCRLIVYGVESGSPAVQKVLRKGITIPQIESAFRLTRRAGIESAAFFMFGTPGETLSDISATMELALRLGADYASFNITTPYPGTPLYWMQGGETSDWQHYDARHAPTGKAQILEELLNRAYRAFYLRPEYVLRRLFKMSRPGELLTLARAGISVVRRYLFGQR